MKVLLFLAAVSFAACACTQSPSAPATSTTDAGATTPCTAACAALKMAGCPMGDDLSCPGLMQTLNDQGKQVNPANGNRPLKCADVVSVKTRADATRMGFICQ